MRSLLILIAAVVVGLAATNPSRMEYLDWVQRQNSDEASSLLFGIVRPLVDASTATENYTLFTVFSTKVDATHGGRVLGLMHRFYALPALSGEIWKPGTKSTSFPHVIAAQAPNEWLPEAGYRWINEPPTRGDFRVRWVPGSITTAFPHVKAGASEGQWFPEDGYVWGSQPQNGDLRVRWQPGKPSENHPHVVSAVMEERWLPEDGYVWNVDPPPIGQLGVHWKPEKASTKYFHVITASQEGRWLPAEGYRWLTNPPPPGDIRVMPIAPPQSFDAATKTPDCSDAFVDAWNRRNGRVWPLPRPPKTCVMHGETGAYLCDNSGCSRI